MTAKDSARPREAWEWDAGEVVGTLRGGKERRGTARVYAPGTRAESRRSEKAGRGSVELVELFVELVLEVGALVGAAFGLNFAARETGAKRGFFV